MNQHPVIARKTRRECSQAVFDRRVASRSSGHKCLAPVHRGLAQRQLRKLVVAI